MYKIPVQHTFLHRQTDAIHPNSFFFFWPLFRLHALVALQIRTAVYAFYAVLPLVASNKASAGDLLRQAAAFRRGMGLLTPLPELHRP
jgi:hypothetical protein